MWFDSHCHLHLCDASPADLWARARQSDVGSLVTIGIDVASSRTALRIATELDAYCSAGLHPNDAGAWDDQTAGELDLLLGDARVVAVGESGLDFYRDSAPPDLQVQVFRDHIELAKGHDKALVIHTRDSLDRALDVLEDAGPPRGVVFHCWSGSVTQVSRAVEMGAFISFAGNVSFKSAENLRDAARAVPLDRLLVETDSPYLAPQPFRGKPNEPAFVAKVGEAVAAARGDHPLVIAEATTTNARNVFGIGS